MGGASILEAVEKLEAGSIKARTDGLEDLKRILNRPTPKLYELKDDGWHKVLDLLFGLINSDKHDFLTGSATAKKRAQNRLETLASALRLVVSFCTPLIKHKTAFAVLDHVSSILAQSAPNEEGFHQIIQLEHLKTFRIIVSHDSHGEHLRPKDWVRYVDFVVQAIDANLANLAGAEDDRDEMLSLSRGISVNESTRNTVAVRASQTSSARGPHSQAVQSLEDLILSLRILSNLSNCPLQTRLGDIAQIVLRTLPTSLQNKDTAVECLNNVLMLALTEDIDLVSHVAAQVLILIRQLWSYKADSKSASLREQMMITLLLLRPLLRSSRNKLDELVVASLGRHLSHDYEDRSDQYCLHISDLVFSRSDVDDLFSRRGVSPDLTSASAALNWVTVSIAAALRSISRNVGNSQGRMDDEENPRKRQKTLTPFVDLVRLLVVDEDDLNLAEAQSMLEPLLSEISDDHLARSSWILLVLSRLCRTTLGRTVALSSYWDKLWVVASQLITSSTNSRAACFTMMTMIEHSGVASTLSGSGLLTSCFHSGTRGPPALSDAALLLFSSCLRSKVLYIERHLREFRDKVLSWLDVVWFLPTVRDHAHNVEVARMSQPYLLLELFNALMGSSQVVNCRLQPSSQSTIHHAYLDFSHNTQFVGYLWDTATFVADRSTTAVETTAMEPKGTAFAKQSEHLIAQFLRKKLKDFTTAFRSIEYCDCKDESAERAENRRRANLSIETADILSTSCTILILLSDAQTAGDISGSIDECWQCVLDYLWLQRNNNASFESSIVRTAQRVLQIAFHDQESQLLLAKKRRKLVEPLRELIVKRDAAQAPDTEIDTEFATQSIGSQQSQGRSPRNNQDISRRDILSTMYIHSTFVEVNELLLQESLGTDHAGIMKLASFMTDFVVELSGDDLLASRASLLEYLDENTILTTSSVTRILQRIAEVCIQDDDNERNEAALCFCLKALHSTIHVWSTTDDEELGDIALDIYSWYIDVALGKGIASPKVLSNIAWLLKSLLRFRPRYACETLPSPRTSLLQILKLGPSSLRFELVSSLTRLFEGYVLTEHAAIFDDIVDCLPTGSDDQEGIAVRLHVLATLGSKWRTVLRQAAYHVFETAANVPSATPYAHHALKSMAMEVGLGHEAAGVLHMFAPQILYTWLEDGLIETIPYAAFGYDTLHELIVAEKEEFIAQSVLRQSASHQQVLENALGTKWSDLLQLGFARSLVYAVATDIVENRAGADAGPSESSLRRQLGETAFSALAKKHFAEAVAHVILSLSDDRGFDKVLASSSRYKSMAQTYRAIQELGSSDVVHPARQQPSFRAKYLMQVLSKICQAAGSDPTSFWSPAILTFVYRKVLDDAISALGPLHIASVIRKIRIVLVLAGSDAHHGYPLEMLLHNLKSYLTNFHCAEDTIGLCWYLLEQSIEHLERNLSFVVGLGVSMFTSLSIFASSSQESTTQESQFVSTMSRAKEFRLWLGKHFTKLDTSRLDPEQGERFMQIIKNATKITTTGTNSSHEPEGDLLHQLLLDQSVLEPLIPKTFFRTIVQALSSDFRNTASPADDILVSERDTIAAAPVLWSILNSIQTPISFRTWAGSVLGKSYIISGPTLDLSLLSTSSSAHELRQTSSDALYSYKNILRTLADMLWDSDTSAASIAEQTLACILTSTPEVSRVEMMSSTNDLQLLEDLVFPADQCPEPVCHGEVELDVNSIKDLHSSADSHGWASSVAEVFITQNNTDLFLHGLIPVLRSQPRFGRKMLPEIVHLVLDLQAEHEGQASEMISGIFDTILSEKSPSQYDHARLVLEVLVFLRKCVRPREKTFAERNSWLAVNFENTAAAALSCNLPQTALLFLEVATSEQALQTSRSRRVTINPNSIGVDLVRNIFQNVQDEDFFYGSHHEDSVESVLAKLRHENQGSRVLAMQSALFDARMKAGGSETAYRQQGGHLVSALSLANLHGLTYATQQYVASSMTNNVRCSLDESILNIHQWDIATGGEEPDDCEIINNVLSRLEVAQTQEDLRSILNQGISFATSTLMKNAHNTTTNTANLVNLAALTDILCLTTISTSEALAETWAHLLSPSSWTSRERFGASSKILMAREAISAAMRRNDKSQDLFHASSKEFLLYEIQAVRSSLATAKEHDDTQFCLNRAIYLTELGNTARGLNLTVERAITYDVANTLWAQGEVIAPIEMLKSLEDSKVPHDEALLVSKAELLTDLGQKLSQARLYRPDEVTANYLQPAIDALDKKAVGSVAGRVYHNFASFCDEQLQDSAGKDDFERAAKIRNRKLQEVTELAEMCKKASGKERETLKQHYAKAKTWLKLDETEYKALKDNRQQLLQSCLENYLRSIEACESYGKDVLRLLSLWLSHSDVSEASTIVRDHIDTVPTMKIAPFVNQLCSRLVNSTDRFQRVLYDLLFRVCRDHPYHTLYQLFAVCKSKLAKNDPVAESRHQAATKLSKDIQSKTTTSQTWVSVHNSNIAFVLLAQEKQDKEFKTGAKISLRDFQAGRKLEQTIQGLSQKIPPPTMAIALRPDKDYSSLPTFSSFEPQITIAGGISAPKITTIVAADGLRYKMLLKGGNDDLRQDAIMEQVFEQVSNLLQDHRPTRQRNLGIRTYKVIPLTHNAGIIEFVQNTVPLHEYLLPAHQRYFPKDWSSNQCKKIISNAQTKSPAERLKAYKSATDHFHPAMRFFFMENFLDPDEWFKKRLNYSRSTAAISILGHVLGLGDRHGHNILLDQGSGEAVHIDLGVAFEAGRVLPIPEVVPFRLTRDTVDGMGLSGVEGPFRRCCNFTMEALRKNQDAIMTILDVLRWDPLYSWSASPLRIQRMQDQQEREAAAAAAVAADSKLTPVPEYLNGEMAAKKAEAGGLNGRLNVNEPGEADRALAVVAKKLSASLSVEATVNDLIRQAVDEQNLAMLYCGWAAYA